MRKKLRVAADVTVTVRHRCPDFAFGSTRGPGALVMWWWVTSADHLYVMPDWKARAAPPVPARVIVVAIRHALRVSRDLAERPDAP